MLRLWERTGREEEEEEEDKHHIGGSEEKEEGERIGRVQCPASSTEQQTNRKVRTKPEPHANEITVLSFDF